MGVSEGQKTMMLGGTQEVMGLFALCISVSQSVKWGQRA